MAKRKMTKYEHLTRSLAASGAEDPKALAAWIGRKKLGKAKFQKKALSGRMAALKKMGNR